jgi:hypothetical protein
LEPGLPCSFFARQTGAHVLLHLLLDVELQLVVQFIFDDAAPEEGTKSKKYIAKHCAS